MRKRYIFAFLVMLLILVGCAAGDPESSIVPQQPALEPWYLGGDVSSIIEAEENGCVFYDDESWPRDIFQILRDSGMNSVRIRIWNDPVDENGKPYANGHNDLDTALQIGQRATEAGLSVFIDFHYSDYWADPSKQEVPKAWRDMGIEEKKQALYDFTLDALTRLLEAGVDVTMVQVGNETTSGLAGETQWDNMTALMSAGSRAVRTAAEQYDREILVAMHFTGCTGYEWFASQLQTYEVDYDVFAASYYPYWGGTPEKQRFFLEKIIEQYGKKVLIAEFAYPYYRYNMDGHGNGVEADAELPFAYPVSREGQQEALRDALELAASLGESCLGLYYWEPTWIGYYGANGAGSPWDNQALFDRNGYPLPALKVFQEYAKDRRIS